MDAGNQSCSLDQLTKMVADFTEEFDAYEVMDQRTGVCLEDGPFALMAAKQVLMEDPEAIVAYLREFADDGNQEAVPIIEAIGRYREKREVERAMPIGMLAQKARESAADKNAGRNLAGMSRMAKQRSADQLDR